MLAAHDLAAAPLFVLPETKVDGQGLLPEAATGRCGNGSTSSPPTRSRGAVVRQTLDGALAALGPAVAGLAEAADDQAAAATGAGRRLASAYRARQPTVETDWTTAGCCAASCSRAGRSSWAPASSCARWSPASGTCATGWSPRVTGRPRPGGNLQAALESQLVTVLRGVAADAAEQAYAGWQAHPAGRRCSSRDLQQPSDGLPERADRVVRDWQRGCSTWSGREAADKRVWHAAPRTRSTVLGLTVMIAVFTSTAFIPTGAEVAVGGGTTVAAQKVLEAIFGDQAIRTLASRAREELLTGQRAARRGGGPVPRAHRGGRSEPSRAPSCGRPPPTWKRQGGLALTAATPAPSRGGAVSLVEKCASADPSRDGRIDAEQLVARLDALSGSCGSSTPTFRTVIWSPRTRWSNGPAAGSRSPRTTPWSRWPAAPAAASPACSTRSPG